MSRMSVSTSFAPSNSSAMSCSVSVLLTIKSSHSKSWSRARPTARKNSRTARRRSSCPSITPWHNGYQTALGGRAWKAVQWQLITRKIWLVLLERRGSLARSRKEVFTFRWRSSGWICWAQSQTRENFLSFTTAICSSRTFSGRFPFRSTARAGPSPPRETQCPTLLRSPRGKIQCQYSQRKFSLIPRTRRRRNISFFFMLC